MRCLTLSMLCLLPFLSGCSIFEFSEYDTFGAWYVGPAGLEGAMGGHDKRWVREDRPAIYGHFRLPEIVFQPVGGLQYPARYTTKNGTGLDNFIRYSNATPGTTYLSITKDAYRERGNPEDSLTFDWSDGGIIEAIPYRTWASDKGVGYKVGVTLLEPLNSVERVTLAAVFRGPFYLVHDALKTVVVPFAALYYGMQGDGEAKSDEEESS